MENFSSESEQEKLQIPDYLAAEIIDRMGASGLPPEKGIEYVTVGLGDTLNVLEKEYLKPMAAGRRGSAFKLIKGSFGFGKTHFLICLRNLARRHGYLTAFTELSLKGCSFGDASSIYRFLAAGITAPPAEDDPYDEGLCGLGAILRTFAILNDEPDARRKLINKLKTSSMDLSYRSVAAEFFNSIWCEDEAMADACEMWLSGKSSGRLKLRSVTISEGICEGNATAMLRSMVQLLLMCGYPGIAALFDEVDRVASGTHRDVKRIVDNMRQFIDTCGRPDFKGVFWAFAVPPEFISNVVAEYPALQQRLNSPRQFSAVSPQVPTIDLAFLGRGTELFSELGRRIARVAESAWGAEFEEDALSANLDNFINYYAENNLDSGQRRGFVKSWIAILQSLRLEPDKVIDLEAVLSQEEEAEAEAAEADDFVDF